MAPEGAASAINRGDAAIPILVIPHDADAEAYVRLALERNPGIRAAEQHVAALAQRIRQATALDDPMLEFTPIGEMAETAAGMVGVMTGISQRFPLGGKLAEAGRVAEADVAVAVAQLAERRLQVSADTRRAYWSFYRSERALEVINQSRAILEQLARTADAQYRAGKVTQQDVLRASVELSELDAEIATLQQQTASAQAMINRLIDRPIEAALTKPLATQLDALSLELDTLLAQAIIASPALQQIAAEIEGDRRRVRLAQLQRIPDLTLSFSYNLVDSEGLSPVANGDDQWWIGFGINLPIWQDRLEAAEREARLNLLRRISELAQERNAVAFRIQDALLTANTAQHRAELFRDVIVPQARQTVDASLSGYRAGSVDFLTLADNWRRLLEFELMYHDNVAQLKRSLADLEEAVGAPVNSVSDVARGSAPQTVPHESDTSIGDTNQEVLHDDN